MCEVHLSTIVLKFFHTIVAPQSMHSNFPKHQESSTINNPTKLQINVPPTNPNTFFQALACKPNAACKINLTQQCKVMMYS
jgi:hypothetical protein